MNENTNNIDSISRISDILKTGVSLQETLTKLYTTLLQDQSFQEKRQKEKQEQDKNLNIYQNLTDSFFEHIGIDQSNEDGTAAYMDEILYSCYNENGVDWDMFMARCQDNGYHVNVDEKHPELDMTWRELFDMVWEDFSLYGKIHFIDTRESGRSIPLTVKKVTAACPLQLVVSHEGKNVARISLRRKLSVYFGDFDNDEATSEEIGSFAYDIDDNSLLQTDLDAIMLHIESRILRERKAIA